MGKRGPKPGSPGARRIAKANAVQRTSEFYRELGRKGGQAVKEKYGVDHLKEIGRKGGEETNKKFGPSFYSQIGAIGGENGQGVPKPRGR